MKSINAGRSCHGIVKYLPIASIFLVAVAVRIVLFWQDKVVAADGISYINVARAIFQRLDFHAASHFPPIYPILIGMASFLTPYDELAGKIVSTIMGSLVVFPLYLLGKEIFSSKTGYIAAVFAALSPTLIAISGIVLSQSTYITISLTALYLWWKSFAANSAKTALAAGLMFAASYLTRPEAIVVFAGISAVFLLFRPASLTARQNCRLLLFAWAGFFILAFPYVLLLHDVYGTWQLTGKSSVTLADSLGWYLNRPDLKREPGFAGLTYLDIVTRYPDFLWKNAFKNLPAVWQVLRPIFWLLALAGVASTCFSAVKWRKLLFLGAALLPLKIIMVFFWIDAHYFSPYIPILFILGGEGLVGIEKGAIWCFERFLDFKIGKRVPLALTIAIALAINIVLPNLLADRNTPYHFTQDGARYDHKLIGLLLKKQLPPNSRVMVKSGRIAFYGDFQQVDIPQAALPDILKAASDGGARFLIADGSLFGARPQLVPFLTPLLIPQEQVFSTGPFGPVPNVPAGLRLVLLYKDPSSVGVAVYEFVR